MADIILILGALGLFSLVGGLTWLNQLIAQYTIKDSKKKQEDLSTEIKKAQEDLAKARLETKKKVEEQKELTPDNIIDFWKNRK